MQTDRQTTQGNEHANKQTNEQTHTYIELHVYLFMLSGSACQTDEIHTHDSLKVANASSKLASVSRAPAIAPIVMAGISAADDTMSFSEFLDQLAETAEEKPVTFLPNITLPDDDEIGEWGARLAVKLAAEGASLAEVLVLVSNLCQRAAKGRELLADGELAALRFIHGSQTGGGKGTKLKVPESDRGNLNAALVQEFDGFIDKQTKIKNDLAQKKITKEVS